MRCLQFYLIIIVYIGNLVTYMSEKYKLNFNAFLATHPVFRLDELAQARGQPDQLGAAHNQLKHHLRRGQVKRVSRGVFAAVPLEAASANYEPDPFLVAIAIRPEGILSHHAALELLGAAHSLWNQCTLFCEHPPPVRSLGRQRIQFLTHPTPLRRKDKIQLGVRRTERRGRPLPFTGPERTLIEGFRQPRWIGGLGELIESATGFGVLDLDLLEQLLTAYDQHALWAAVGFFLERHQADFFVPDAYLRRLEKERPQQPHYLVRTERGGQLVPRWNLIVPRHLLTWEGQDAQS